MVLTSRPNPGAELAIRTYEDDTSIFVGGHSLDLLLSFLYIQPIPKQILVIYFYHFYTYIRMDTSLRE